MRGEPIGGATLRQAIAKQQKAVTTVLDGTVQPPQPATLGGSDALRFDYRAGAKQARQVGAVHKGRFYSVTIESAPAQFQRSVAVLDAFLRSWRWK